MEFRRRLTILISISLGIIFVFSAAIVFLAYDIVNRTNRITSLRGELSSRREGIQSLASLRQDFEKSKIYSANLQNVLPTRDQLLKFSPDLNTIATQNKINFSSSLGNEERGENTKVGETSFNITAQGSFENLINFLKDVSNSRYPLKFVSLDLVQDQKNEFKISLTGKVLSF